MKYFFSLIVLIFSATIFFSQEAVAAKVGKKVLLLNSYSYDQSWTRSITEAIVKIFDEKSDVKLLVEFMDTKRHKSPEHYSDLYRIYLRKYANAKFDVIITSDDNAVNFALKHREKLFPQVPIIFCGVNNIALPIREDFNNITGTLEVPGVRETVETALKLHPGLKKLYLINESGTSGKSDREAIELVLEHFSHNFESTWIEDYNEKDLSRKLATIGDDSFIILLSFFIKKQDAIFSISEGAKFVTESTSRPVYSMWEYFLGKGIIGGMVTSGKYQGETAAHLAQRVLNGENPNTIPVVSTTANRFMFDYNQLERFDININRLPDDSIVINRQFSFYEKNRSIVWKTISVFSILAALIIILFININRRKKVEVSLLQSEKTLRKNEAHLYTLIQTIPDLVWLKDPEGVYLSCNHRFERFFGVNEFEIIGKTDYDFVEKELAGFFRKNDMSAIAAEKPSINEEALTYADDGHTEQVEMIRTPMYDSSGNVTGVLGVGRNITKRKKAEADLNKRERKYRTILETALDGFWITDINGTFLEVNDAYTNISGYSKTELLTMKISDIEAIENQEKTFKHLQLCMQSGYDRFETVHRRKDGSFYNVDVNVRYLPIDGGKFVVFIYDITERKQIEAHLQQAQKMESIGTLAGGIAHDFNNILFPILGHTEMLLEDASEDSPLRSSLDGIYTGALRASELVKQILTFSRQENNKLTLMKMQPIIKEVLKLIRSTIPTTIEIKQDISPACDVIKADPTQIHQIVMNLATNAYHSMEDTGGELKVSLNEVELGALDLTNPDMATGVYVCLTVADTGKGMDKNLTDKIFDPFFTTKEKGKGTGMGLSVVHGIVTSMNGAIQVYSEPGKGTVFNVYLPLEKSLLVEHETRSKAEIQRGTEQILLVDDEEAILTMEKLMLERLGYQVTSRTSSMEALEAFRDSPDKFNLVITDMAMPNMPGDKLSAELTKIRPDIPVLLCTGFSETMSEEKAASLGINGFLLKPIVMKDLSQKIREVLDK